jgi:hypothetical protein
MTIKEFKEQLKLAECVVSKWPKWKREILEQSAKPTVEFPRTPIFKEGIY